MQRHTIRVLDDHLINLIAAGEVVENPASCIKELVENAIDAKSSSIRVEILGGGFECIRIMDNGIGMPKEDAKVCFERHATSKVREQNDLRGIQTLGFRGEALSSIASISHMEMKTAPIEGGEATFIEVKAGKILRLEPASREHGTTLDIYSLFYNVPARLEFQKSIRAATMEVTKMMQRLALSQKQVRFTYVIDKKVEFDCAPTDDLKVRAEAIFGADWVETMNFIDFEENKIRCLGLISRPDSPHKTRAQQFFFINERTATAPIIQSAVYESYKNHFPPKNHPALILFMEIPFMLVDVNVHPQKSIVRLKEEQHWFHIVQKAVDRAFLGQLTGQLSPQFSSQSASSSFAPSSSLPWQSAPQFDAFNFPMERANRSYATLSSSEEKPLKSVLTFQQKSFIDLTGIMIIDGFLFAKLEEKHILVDLEKVEQQLALEQMRYFESSVQTECILRTIRLESLFDLEEKELLKKLAQFGIQARFISKMALSIEGLAPCIEPERLDEVIVSILEHPHRAYDAIIALILPKMRKGYLRRDTLLATNGLRELLETEKDLKGRVYVLLNEENLKRCFAWKGSSDFIKN